MATKLGTAKKSEHEKERRRDIEGDRASERVKSICLEQVTVFLPSVHHLCIVSLLVLHCAKIGGRLN